MKIETLERRLKLLENPDVIALFRMIAGDKADIKEIKSTLESSLKRDISAEKEKMYKNQCKLW